MLNYTFIFSTTLNGITIHITIIKNHILECLPKLSNKGSIVYWYTGNN